MTARTRILAMVAAATMAGLLGTVPPASAANAAGHQAATPVKHFIFLMQGGRTFDNYFGTYPGAAGLRAGTCQPVRTGDPGGKCVRPFLLGDARQVPLGASRTVIASQWDDGKMDGFVAAYQRQGRTGAEAMGHYDATALPFYWAAARNYVLFDHFFSSAQYGIRDNRSYWVAARPAPRGSGRPVPDDGYGAMQTIFDRLQAAHVSWKFYVQDYNRSQTYQSASPASPQTQTQRVPLVNFRRFTRNPALASHIVGLGQYYRDLMAGTLPAVAYVASSASHDERSAQSIVLGQALVATMVTQLMESGYWGSSALMWSYDGSGGWFDGVRPPETGGVPLGFRVPALLVSAYARKGQVNHTVLDYTSALRFIEQNWGLAPLTARDAKANSIASAFDFASGPRPAVVLRAGPASAVDPYPAAHSLSPRHVIVVYVLYAGVLAAGLALLVIAAWTGRAVRGRPRAARGAKDPEEAAG